MKHPISWHKECLANLTSSYHRKLVELSRVQREVVTMEEQLVFLEEQIIEAVRRGLEGFDEDKFMKKK